jgi:hypothetical protein
VVGFKRIVAGLKIGGRKVWFDDPVWTVTSDSLLKGVNIVFGGCELRTIENAPGFFFSLGAITGAKVYVSRQDVHSNVMHLRPWTKGTPYSMGSTDEWMFFGGN